MATDPAVNEDDWPKVPPPPPPTPTAPGAGARAPKRTFVARGAVPPAAASTGSGQDHRPTHEHQDFQRHRDSRVGTRMAGIDGLHAPGSEAPKLRLTAGKIVPGTRYRILRWLGEGGMGVVYEAEHIDIERKVALKILRFDLSQQPKMVQVFRDEARAASRLGSPNLVEIYDFGELPDGRLFFAMELLDGRDLVPETEADVMEPQRLIPILRQVCKGLSAAHGAGVVHRDVKPENIIIVRRQGRNDCVKIVDFGISAMLAAGQPGHGGGGIAGTPHYMAPEQISGIAFDGRLDIYALGVTAYELLVGRPPFEAEDIEELLRLHLAEPVPPPSTMRPDAKVPPALEQVVMRCLAKEPRERFANAAELEAALCEAQIAAGIHTAWDDLPLPELDDPERREELLRRMPSPVALPAQPRKLLWPIIAGVSTLAAGLLAFLLLGRGPTQQDRDVVEDLTIQARDAAAKADWVYPPATDPETPTAFQQVVALEALTGPVESLGDDRGETLRTEFANTLVGHGDRLWGIEGARRLAREYYMWALVFKRDHQTAFERAGVPLIEIQDLAKRASAGKFSRAELLLAQAAAIEVTDDPEEKAQKQQKLDDAIDEVDDLTYAAELILDETTKGRSTRRRRAKRGSAVQPPAAPVPGPDAATPPTVEDQVELIEEAAPEPTKAAPAKKKRRVIRGDATVLNKAKRDPARARELAEQGRAALRKGNRSKAESLFNQAIGFDSRNAAALMGLSDVYFDTGSNAKAVLYAERAVKASPRNKAARLKLGDAYFKVLRYRDALKQYEEAKKNGSRKATARIAKVKARIGG